MDDSTMKFKVIRLLITMEKLLAKQAPTLKVLNLLMLKRKYFQQTNPMTLLLMTWLLVWPGAHLTDDFSIVIQIQWKII